MGFRRGLGHGNVDGDREVLPRGRGILADDPELERRLDGFTLFTDTLGVYPTTAAGLPASLGAPVYAPDQSLTAYRTSARDADTVPRMLVDAGFRANIAMPSPGGTRLFAEVGLAPSDDLQDDILAVLADDVDREWNCDWKCGGRVGL